MGDKSREMENLVNRELLYEKFSNKKVFVTGHTGFKGSWLIAILNELKASVAGYALHPVLAQNLYNTIQGEKKVLKSIIHDIRDKQRIKDEILAFKPDFIFHLAAQPLVRYSYKEPLETFEVNAMGTAYVLDAVRKLPGKCTVIIITTDKVYYNNESKAAFKEDDRLGGYDPYSSSKALAELVTESYRNSFFNVSDFKTHNKAMATARAGNVIGGGDWSKDRIVPDIVRALVANEPVEIRNPTAIRPWQHVMDPLFGYLLLAAKLDDNAAEFSGAWNFGPLPGDELTVSELVNITISAWGSGSFEILNATKLLHEANNLKLNISKSLKMLSWKPLLNANEAIRWTIDWYKQEDRNKKEFTFHQIAHYLSL